MPLSPKRLCTSVSQVLQDVRQKYANSEKSQLETVADWLLAAFQESELQFLNILHDQPMDKACPCSCRLHGSDTGTPVRSEALFTAGGLFIPSLGFSRTNAPQSSLVSICLVLRNLALKPIPCCAVGGDAGGRGAGGGRRPAGRLLPGEERARRGGVCGRPGGRYLPGHPRVSKQQGGPCQDQGAALSSLACWALWIRTVPLQSLQSINTCMVVHFVEMSPACNALHANQPSRRPKHVSSVLLQVGLVVTTALVLRSVPESLLPLAPSLLSRGRNLTGSGRLPLLLWVLLQATRRAPSG